MLLVFQENGEGTATATGSYPKEPPLLLHELSELFFAKIKFSIIVEEVMIFHERFWRSFSQFNPFMHSTEKWRNTKKILKLNLILLQNILAKFSYTFLTCKSNRGSFI